MTKIASADKSFMTDLFSFEKVIDENRSEGYFNTIVSFVNDHVIRLSIMTHPYPWHVHPNSDETFIGVEGTVIIETLYNRIELTPGTSVTIPRNELHRSFPLGERSVNLTVGSKDMHTDFRPE
jgi:mannose-6-phosphate isomerase-like protein (cupin superfamily)